MKNKKIFSVFSTGDVPQNILNDFRNINQELCGKNVVALTFDRNDTLNDMVINKYDESKIKFIGRPLKVAAKLTRIAYNNEAIFSKKYGPCINISEKKQLVTYKTFDLISTGVQFLLAKRSSLLIKDEEGIPVDFIIIYSPDGAKTPDDVNKNDNIDVTKTSKYLTHVIFLANMLEIPIFNLQRKTDIESLRKMVNSL